MPSAERIQQLNQEIHSNLEQAVSTLRRTLLDRLQASAQNLAQDLVHRVEEIQAHLPSGPWVQQDAFGDEAREAESTGAAAAAASLRDGLKSLDAARTQAEVLNALLREARRFASRTAVVLNRGSEVRGWAAHGFNGSDGEQSLRDHTFHFSSNGAWGRLSDGAVPLAAAECAELCSRLESALPQEGVLIPIVLRDRLAAALYADRQEDGALQVESLQVLAFVASQVIETLPFRERATTATLQSAAAAEPAAAAAPEPEVAAAPEPAPVAESAPEIAAAPEPEAAEIAEVPEVAEAPTLGLDDTAPGINAGWTVEEDDTPAAEAAAFTATAPLAPLAADELPAEAWVEEEVELEAEPEPAPARTAGFAPPPPAAETVLLQRPTAVPAPAPITATFPMPRMDSPVPPAAPAAPPEPAAPPAPASSAAEPGGRSLGSTAEVAPPTDVQGPGWAFATTRVAVSPDDEMAHEEARRLARLLVSEIKLYNEEQVEEGRRNRDVYERLKEDIDRSRQMYEERVEPRILRSTDYFYQELVRILAAGDARTLGI